MRATGTFLSDLCTATAVVCTTAEKTGKFRTISGRCNNLAVCRNLFNHIWNILKKTRKSGILIPQEEYSTVEIKIKIKIKVTRKSRRHIERKKAHKIDNLKRQKYVLLEYTLGISLHSDEANFESLFSSILYYQEHSFDCKK